MYNRNHLTIEEHEILGWLAEQPKKDRFFIYGRPWHFIGYGVSSIHYDRARQMSSAELKKLVDKYQGEVYYIRGLDCWDSHTYHKKAVEHRIATTCDVFERDMDLEGVKNILITNNYWVQIAKFNGRKEFNPKNIIAVSDLELTNVSSEPADSASAKQSLLYRFSLNERAAIANQWDYTILLNGDTLAHAAYASGSFSGSIAEDKLMPGYNSVEYIVLNRTNGKLMADVQKFYFNKATGATPLVELPYVSHKQGWAKLNINKSLEGNTFKVGGKLYSEGLGTHASSETVYNIGGKFKTFKMGYGLDEESLCSDRVQLQIIADGNVIHDSGRFALGKLRTAEVNVENVQTLTIKTYSLEDMDCDHVDIINPVLIP
jgi:hypothetical protein